MLNAFEYYEKAIQQGKLRYYGITADRSVKLNDKQAEKIAFKGNVAIDKVQQNIYDIMNLAE